MKNPLTLELLPGRARPFLPSHSEPFHADKSRPQPQQLEAVQAQVQARSFEAVVKEILDPVASLLGYDTDVRPILQ